MVIHTSVCNGSGDWLKTAATEIAGGGGRTMCETDKGTFKLQFGYILGYILKGGETQLSKLHILTTFDKNFFSTHPMSKIYCSIFIVS